MSNDTLTADPFTDFAADIPEDNVRDYGAALVRNGATVEEVNRHLAVRSAAPLKANSAEMAELARDRLMRDEGFLKRWNEGDPAAIDQLNMADMKVLRAAGKLTDRDITAAEYDFSHVAHHVSQDVPAENVQKFTDEMSKVSADLRIPPDNARAIVDMQLSTAGRLATMTPTEREDFGHEQTRALESVVSGEQIKEAEGILSRAGRQSFDLRRIAQQSGANVAVSLLQQAEHLKAIGRA